MADLGAQELHDLLSSLTEERDALRAENKRLLDASQAVESYNAALQRELERVWADPLLRELRAENADLRDRLHLPKGLNNG